jgi:phosphatidate cytidylyltransferase
MSQAAPLSSDAKTSKTRRKFLGFEVTLDWLLRPLFGITLAAIAIAALYFGGYWFAAFIVVGAVAAVREWHRMRATSYSAYWIISAAGIVSAAVLEVAFSSVSSEGMRGLPWLVLAVAALINSVLGSTRRVEALWHAAALFYIGVPALCLVAMREVLPHAFWLLLAIFISVWATDTGALFAGNLLKGPKLWPALSPNKTWAGFIGGTVFGAVFGAIVFALAHGNLIYGAVLGAIAAVVGAAGDLFESFLKRRVGRKNSGSLIPGHGGVLDRIDSMLFVAPVAAVLFLLLHIDPLVGAMS